MTRCLIVGAGPTGLTAAVELARLGVDAQLIDRRDAASGLSRAVGILPDSLRLLAPSGVADRLLAEGQKLTELRLFDGTTPLGSVPMAGADPDHPYVLALAQDRTEAILRDAAAERGVTLRFGADLADIEDGASGVTAVLTDGSRIAADMLLGADGIRSTVRHWLDVDYPGHDLPEKWSIADVNATGWPHQQAFAVCLGAPGEVAVVAPMEAQRYRVVANTPDALATLRLPLNVTAINRQGEFAISVRQATSYGRGRVWLAGDAAHCHSPVGGRGMNLGIADAAAFAERLAGGELDGYSAARHAAGAEAIGLSERGRKMISRPSRTTRALIRLGFGAAIRLPPLRAALARRALQV